MEIELREQQPAMSCLRAFTCLAFLQSLLFGQLAAVEATNKPARTNVHPPIVPPAAPGPPAGFSLQRGFSIQLVAAEPMVVAPIAMAFDEKGRLFVLEMPDWSASPNESNQEGRIRVLEDANGDGVFDSSSVYADNLSSPSALACYGGGVFVAAGSDIYYLKDTHGDGVADLKELVFSGFGAAAGGKPAGEAMLNSFSWGLDNRIHGGAAGLGGTIIAVKASGAPKVELGRNDFSFDPRTLTLWPEIGSAQTGLCFDNRGRKFITDYGSPLRMQMYELRYTLRNPFFLKAPEVSDTILRQGLPVPARVSTITNRVSQNVRTNNTPWLESPRGTLIYRGSAFPTNYSENVFIADPAAHSIRRLVLRDQGLQVFAERPAQVINEFLISSNAAFRPMHLSDGPDGALYVADVQNVPGRGRIYRITPQNYSAPKFQLPAKASTRELVAMLAYANGWHRNTAARLLYERHDPAAAPLLTNMVNNARLPLARLRALRALDGLGALNEPVIMKGLHDVDERVREHAVELSERLARNGNIPDALWNQLASMSADPAIRVRYQLAFTLGELRRAERAFVMAEILRRNPEDPWFRSAILSSLGQGAGDVFVTLAGDPAFRLDKTGQSFLRELSLMIGVKGRAEEAFQLVSFFGRTTLEPQPAFAFLGNFGEGLRRNRSSLALVDPQGTLAGLYAQALSAVGNDPNPKSREDAIRLLGVSPYNYADVADVLLLLIGTGEAQEIQSAAITSLGRFRDPGVTNLFVRWPALSVVSRNDAITVLLSYAERVPALLAPVQNRSVALSDFSSTQLNFLRTHPNPAIRQQALRLFGPVSISRPDSVKQFLPATHLSGLAARGRDIFLGRCAICHKLGGEGGTLGPDLGTARHGAREKLLRAILQPNSQFRPDYATVIVETKATEDLVGVRSDENPLTITLNQLNRTPAIWPRANVESMQPQLWSLMPEGLEQGLDLQAMADLLEYIMTAPR
jgi:putative membrane-bound dehydrogenase-like protein